MALVIRSKTFVQPTSAACSGARSHSLIDPVWESIDPNPNIHNLFLQFNDEYFESRLAGIEVKWSPKMTLCAGLCSYEGHGGLCSIRLSQPLLKFRPRKDLVETLLHEMIHAFLFVTQNNKDHDAHGPEFHRIMFRINAVAGTKITVYHSFHAEVAEHRKHWWRCEGACRNAAPFFGWVKRSMNRAPGSYDNWFEDHQKKCGGRFVKIKEPEDFQAKMDKPTKSQSSVGIEKSRNDIPRKKKQKTEIDDGSKSLHDYFSKLPGTGHALEDFSKKTVKASSNFSEEISLVEKVEMVKCPVCHTSVPEERINLHLDFCISK